MSRGLASVCILIVLCGTEAGCAPRSAAPPVPVNRREIPQPKSTWPAPTWVARFASPTRLTACTNIDKQSRLCVGELGERWLDDPAGARPSPYLAPETLITALPTASQHFVFVGQRGTRYFADSALGPFTAMQISPQKHHRFQVTAGRWYGLNIRGELWRGPFEDRNGTRLDLPDNLYDFAIAPSGRGIAVGIPEQLWLTQDAGDHWTAVDFGSLGTTGVSLDAEGRLRLIALLPSQAPGPAGIIVDDARHAQNLEVKLHQSPAVAPDIRALEEGRAVFSSNKWFELSQRDTGWHFAHGQFDQPLQTTKTAGLEDCAAVRMTTRDRTVTVLCQSRELPTGSDKLTVRVADVAKLEFARLSGNVQGRLREVRIEALDARRILATGLCALQPATGAATAPAEAAAAAAATASATATVSATATASVTAVAPAASSTRSLFNAKHLTGCVANEPVILALAPTASPGMQLSIEPVVAPGAHITARPLAVSNDGQEAAFVARADGTAPWQLYLSSDKGRTFSVRVIDMLPVTSAPGSNQFTRKGSKQRDTRVVQSLNFGDDRSLSLVVKDGDTPVIFNFDDRGQLVASSLPPPAVSRVDAVGTRILAVSLTQRDVFQSIDRGASFELVAHLPSPACLSHAACPVICRSAGCLIGDRYTRVSWGSPGVEPLDIAGNPEARESTDEPMTERVSFRTPLICRTRAYGPPLVPLSNAPLAEQTSLGGMLWYAPWQDIRNASAGLYLERRNPRSFERTMAFQPLRFPGDAGLALQFDDAGVAFMRSIQVPKAGDALGDIELASWLFKRPTWVQARFRDAVAITTNDFYLLGAGKARRLLPSMLTTSENGVFVQAHTQGQEPQNAQLVAPGAVTPLEPIAWPVEHIRDVHWTKVNGTWQVYALDETGSVLLRATKPVAASRDSKGWTFSARTIANPQFSTLPPGDRVKFSWGQARPMLFLARGTGGRHLQSLSAHALSNDAKLLGPSFDVRLPDALSEKPPTCSARDRRELTRVVLPLLPAAARAVEILEDDEQPRWLVATQAVLYVSAKRACIDVLWAEAMPGMTPMNAVMGLDDLGHATVFRSEKGQLQARATQCAFDASARPPPETEARMQARWNLEHLPLSEP